MIPAPGTSAQPWRTLQHAANTVQAGDLVIVRAGTYAGFDLAHQRHPGQPDRVPRRARRDRQRAQPGRRPTTASISKAPSWVVIQGFTVTGMPRTGIRAVLNHHVTIRGNTLNANGYWGVLTGFSDDVLIENNDGVELRVEHGIYVSNSGDRPIIRRNHVCGNNANGIHMNGDVSLGRRRHHHRRAGRGQHHPRQRRRPAAPASTATACRARASRTTCSTATTPAASRSIGSTAAARRSNNVVAHNTILQASDGRWADQHHQRAHRQHRAQQHPLQLPQLPRQHHRQRRQPDRPRQRLQRRDGSLHHQRRQHA